jgi:hypothetical protein
MKMTPDVLYILGTSFSGSSLLNSLFDAQPSTRGLGEAIHLLRKPTNAWCSHCQCPVEACRLQHAIDPEHFYESVANFYPESRVFVNSSKQWKFCFEQMPPPPENFRVRLIVLSKSLEEFAHSYSRHNDCPLERAFNVWVRYYQHLLRNLDDQLQRLAITPSSSGTLFGNLTQEDVCFLTYRELATETDSTLRTICNRFELPFSDAYRAKMWNSNTCTIGGNNAIYAQRSANATFFESGSAYLDGKYSGKQGTIFCDNQWVSDQGLLEAADLFRSERQREVEALERRLLHPQRTPLLESIDVAPRQ